LAQAEGVSEVDEQTPVDIVVAIQKDLAKFQRTCHDKEELRASIRELLRETLLQAIKEHFLAMRPSVPPNPVIEHFRQQKPGPEGIEIADWMRPKSNGG
jgi:hypothetical protein